MPIFARSKFAFVWFSAQANATYVPSIMAAGTKMAMFGVPSSFDVETTHSVWYAMTASCSCVSVKVVYLFVAKLAEDTASTHSCTSPALAPASCCGASAAALCCCGAHPDRPAPAMMPRAPVAAIP